MMCFDTIYKFATAAIPKSTLVAHAAPSIPIAVLNRDLIKFLILPLRGVNIGIAVRPNPCKGLLLLVVHLVAKC